MSDNEIYDGGPAFPVVVEWPSGPEPYFGLSKREFFAGLAMHALIGHREYFIGQEQYAIDIADGLLAALERPPATEDAPEPSDPGKMVLDTADAMNRCYAITHGFEAPGDYDSVKGWPDVLTDRQIEREIEEQEQEQEKEREQ